jgi:type I restriction enzyme S subunit
LPSFEEQARIIVIIENLAALISEATRLRVEATEQAEGLFFAGCEKVLHDLERRVSCVPLRELVDKKRGISYGIVQTGRDTDDGIPTLRAGDLRWFAVGLKDIKRVSPDIERGYERTRLRGGELLLRIRGGVGDVAVCPKDLIGGNVSREIAVIPLQPNILPGYAMYLMAAPTIQNRMAEHVKGTSYVGINLRDVRALRLPIPAITDQRHAVTELETLRAQADALVEMQKAVAVEIEAMLPSILDRAFSEGAI